MKKAFLILAVLALTVSCAETTEKNVEAVDLSDVSLYANDYSRPLVDVMEDVAQAFGVNGIQFGIIVVFNLMIGVLSPPFGVCLFAVSKVAKLPMGRLIRALVPWFVILLVALAIITIFPGVSTWLPSLMNLG